MTNISTSNVFRDRMDFAKIHTSIPIPNLIEVQRKSYHRFLQMDVPPSEREDVGLQAVFNSVFAINDFRGTSSLEFVEYSIGNWQCKCGESEGSELPARQLHRMRQSPSSTVRTIPRAAPADTAAPRTKSTTRAASIAGAR